MAPAGYTDPKNCAEVLHYRHPNDIVPRIDRYGARMFSHTIRDVGIRSPNIFKWHHRLNDKVYDQPLLKHVENYVRKNKL